MSEPIDPAQLEGDDLTRATVPDGVEVPTHLYGTASDEVVAVLDTITDPLSRFWACEDAARGADQRGRIAEVRRDAVRALRGEGRPPLRTWEQVGELLGVSTARAQQLARMDSDRNAPRGPRTQRRPASPCNCACTSGGLCGGCGHAGCGGR